MRKRNAKINTILCLFTFPPKEATISWRGRNHLRPCWQLSKCSYNSQPTFDINIHQLLKWSISIFLSLLILKFKKHILFFWLLLFIIAFYLNCVWNFHSWSKREWKEITHRHTLTQEQKRLVRRTRKYMISCVLTYCKTRRQHASGKKPGKWKNKLLIEKLSEI